MSLFSLFLLWFAQTSGGTLPQPSLAGVEAVVVSRLEEARAFFDQEAAKGDALQTSEAAAQLAELYHAYGFLQEAEAAYRLTLSLDPSRHSAQYLFARLLLQQGRYEQAEPLFDACLAFQPQDAATWYWLGEIYLAGNRTEAAFEAFSQAFQLQPRAAGALAGIGRAQLAMGRADQARASFESAQLLLPQADRLFFYIGTAARKQGDLEAAKAAFAKAGSIGAAMPDPLYARLQSRTVSERLLQVEIKKALSAGDYPGAISLLEELLCQNPDQAAAWVNLGSAQTHLGAYASAVHAFETALSLQPQSASALFNLSQVLLRLGRTQASKDALEQLLFWFPEDREARYALATLQMSDRQFVEALSHFELLASENPHQETILVERARLLLHLGQYDRAFTVLKADHERVPDSGLLAHLLARLLATSPNLSQRDGAQALLLARAVVSASPSATHWETLGLAAREVGDCTEAATAFSQAEAAAVSEGLPAEKVQRLGAAATQARSEPCTRP